VDYKKLLLVAFLIYGCSNSLPRFGTGGRYEEGRDQFLRGRGGDMDKAVVAFEAVVTVDPTYKDSLTYLGRAYYRKQRYQDAFAILQRALAVNPDNEIAWISLGMTQLQLGQNEKGIETLKSGITLASKVMVEGYHNYEKWDIRRTIQASIRRSAFLLISDPQGKEKILQSLSQLLAQVDDEENFQKTNHVQNVAPLYR
jgi:tetratricopeptide (TPR) repeat protein